MIDVPCDIYTTTAGRRKKNKKKKDFSFSRVVLGGNKRKTLSTPMLIRIFDSKFNFSYLLSFFIWGSATL